MIASELVNRACDEGGDHGDPRKTRRFDARVLETLRSGVDGLRALTCVRTKSSGLELACG